MIGYDMEIFCKTIFGEARGESRQGQIAVACCILNRYHSKKWYSGSSIARVCLKPWQFSCWNKNDPNAQKLSHLSPKYYKKYMPIIEEAMAKDITNGATHYYNPHICPTPKWAEGKEPCFKEGLHLFFKDID